MEAPAVVYVGPVDYEIKQPKQFDLLGETLAEQATIKLRRKQSESTKRVTLLHEILHAIFWESGYRQIEDMSAKREERIIQALAPWLVSVIRDNPDLVKYIQSEEA